MRWSNLADGTVRLEDLQRKPGKTCVADLQPKLIAWFKWADAYGRLDLAYDQGSFTRVRVLLGSRTGR
jgi:hypothetical protein